MNSHCVSNLHLGQKSPWTNVSLDKSLLGLMSLGQRSSWKTIAWTNVATPLFKSACPSRNCSGKKKFQENVSNCNKLASTCNHTPATKYWILVT